MLDLDEALLDVDVGAAVLTHRAELDEVAVDVVLDDGEDDVEVVLDVVELGEDRVAAIGHRVRRRGDLAVVDDGLGPEVAEEPVHQVVVTQVERVDVDRLARHLAPGVRALREVQDRGDAVAARLADHLATQVVVDHGYVVTVRRQTHRGGPTEIPVASEHECSHRHSSSADMYGRNLSPKGCRTRTRIPTECVDTWCHDRAESGDRAHRPPEIPDVTTRVGCRAGSPMESRAPAVVQIVWRFGAAQWSPPSRPVVASQLAADPHPIRLTAAMARKLAPHRSLR